jgi:hypothetical protein
MKTQRRHELQTNDLAVWLTEAVETAKPYAKLVAGILIAAAVLLTFYVVMSGRSLQKEETGWTQYFKATSSPKIEDLADVVRDYPNTSVAYWSHLTLGDRHLNEGVELRFKDWGKAEVELRAAIESYRAAMNSSEPLVQQRAALGLAQTYETQQELDKAREHYQAVADQWPDTIYGDLASKRLADLNSQPTKKFYDWFAGQEPKPPLEGEGLAPGTQIPFELDSGDAKPAGEKPQSSGPPPVTPGAAQPIEEEPPTSTDEPASATEPAESTEPAAGEPGDEEGSGKEESAGDQPPATPDEPATPDAEPSSSEAPSEP